MRNATFKLAKIDFNKMRKQQNLIGQQVMDEHDEVSCR